jgi:hypothetical protein
VGSRNELRFSEKNKLGVLIFGNKTIPKNTLGTLLTKLGTFTQQTEVLEGIANIKPLLAYF